MKKGLIISLAVLVVFCQATFAQPSKKELDEYLKVHTLVIMKNDSIIFHNERGIKPLIIAINKGELKDAYIADRTAGKAAALLYTYGGVKKVYVQMTSKPAIKVLKANHIKYKTNKVVDNIMNRTKTGLCPMEKKVVNVEIPQQAWEILSKEVSK